MYHIYVPPNLSFAVTQLYYSQIVDGNAKTDVSNRKEPGLFCGEIEQPQTFISETNFVKIVFHADNFTDQTYFSFDSRSVVMLNGVMK